MPSREEKATARAASREERQAARLARAPRLERQGDYVVEVRGKPGQERLRRMTFEDLDRRHSALLAKLEKLQSEKDTFFPDDTWTD